MWGLGDGTTAVVSWTNYGPGTSISFVFDGVPNGPFDASVANPQSTLVTAVAAGVYSWSYTVTNLAGMTIESGLGSLTMPSMAPTPGPIGKFSVDCRGMMLKVTSSGWPTGHTATVTVDTVTVWGPTGLDSAITNDDAGTHAQGARAVAAEVKDGSGTVVWSTSTTFNMPCATDDGPCEGKIGATLTGDSGFDSGTNRYYREWSATGFDANYDYFMHIRVDGFKGDSHSITGGGFGLRVDTAASTNIWVTPMPGRASGTVVLREYTVNGALAPTPPGYGVTQVWFCPTSKGGCCCGGGISWGTFSGSDISFGSFSERLSRSSFSRWEAVKPAMPGEISETEPSFEIDFNAIGNTSMFGAGGTRRVYLWGSDWFPGMQDAFDTLRVFVRAFSLLGILYYYWCKTYTLLTVG